LTSELVARDCDIPPLSINAVTLKLRHHFVALWWLGLLYRNPKAYRDSLGIRSRWRSAHVVWIQYGHVLLWAMPLAVILKSVAIVNWSTGRSLIGLTAIEQLKHATIDSLLDLASGFCVCFFGCFVLCVTVCILASIATFVGIAIGVLMASLHFASRSSSLSDLLLNGLVGGLRDGVANSIGDALRVGIRTFTYLAFLSLLFAPVVGFFRFR
jgi:hypothetical protein